MGPPAERLVNAYNRGSYTDLEIISRLLCTCEPDELDGLPPKIEAALWKQVHEAPTTDEGWSQLITVRSWNGPWNEQIAERIRQQDTRDHQHVRRIVEELRARKAAK
jgi:hypothetical protein